MDRDKEIQNVCDEYVVILKKLTKDLEKKIVNAESIAKSLKLQTDLFEEYLMDFFSPYVQTNNKKDMCLNSFLVLDTSYNALLSHVPVSVNISKKVESLGAKIFSYFKEQL